MNPPNLRMNVVERALVSAFPKWGRAHIANRMAIDFLGGGGTSGYRTPGSRITSMRGWLAAPNHVDRDTIPVLGGTRAGARDLVMNSPLASGILRRACTNSIGYGLSMRASPDRKFLKLAPDAAKEWERNTEREWRLWANSQECDIRRTLSFNEMQWLVLFSVLLSGDCFVLTPWVKRKGSVYDLRVQIIEADFVSNPLNEMETSTISGGVETDVWGAPIAYHLKTIPPNFPILAQTSVAMSWLGKWTRVEAYGKSSGRRNVLHIMHTDRPGQRRGVSLLAPVLEKLKNLSRLSEAELTAAVVTSFFTVFIKKPLPGADNGPLSQQFTGDNSVLNPSINPTDKNLYEMGPGNIFELQDGEDIETAAPKRPNSLFEPFFNAMVKEIGSHVGIPAEEILLEFNSSYSASRAALLEAWKLYYNERHWITDKFVRPVYESWLTEAVIKGRIEAPGFFEDDATRIAWCGSRWTGPGPGQIDPAVETQAARSRIEGRLSTYEDEYTAVHGGSWENAMERQESNESLLEELGLNQILLKSNTEIDPNKEEELGATPANTAKPGTGKNPPVKKVEQNVP